MKATIVIPTIRESSIQPFLEAWESQLKGQRVIVVEDNERKSFKLPKWVEHYAHEDIIRRLDDDASIISLKSSAIRNFGTLLALDDEIDMVWHLDDDCLPLTGTELQDHWDSLHYETDMQAYFSSDAQDRHIRGLPYQRKTRSIVPVLNHGTWAENADYDAIHQLSNPYKFEPYDDILAIGEYQPICGMNVAFKPEIAAAIYFAPTGDYATYDRIDDIWMGVVAKRILDTKRLYIKTGYPQIKHSRASDPFKNLIKEAESMEINEYFWQYIDAIELDNQKPVAELAKDVAVHMMQHSLGMNPDYIEAYGQRLYRWAELCQNS